MTGRHDEQPSHRPRFPRSVYARGSDPDPRFSLANERTFLAWIRTSLALTAVGVALEALAVPVHPDQRLAAAVVFIVLGLVAAVSAWTGWACTERALREQRTLPGAVPAGIISIGVVAGIALLLWGLVA